MFYNLNLGRLHIVVMLEIANVLEVGEDFVLQFGKIVVDNLEAKQQALWR